MVRGLIPLFFFCNYKAERQARKVTKKGRNKKEIGINLRKKKTFEKRGDRKGLPSSHLDGNSFVLKETHRQ